MISISQPRSSQHSTAIPGSSAISPAPSVLNSYAFLCRLHLERIDQLSATILELSARIEEDMHPFACQLEQLATIPGWARLLLR